MSFGLVARTGPEKCERRQSAATIVECNKQYCLSDRKTGIAREMRTDVRTCRRANRLARNREPCLVYKRDPKFGKGGMGQFLNGDWSRAPQNRAI
ncbi:hypothetical protein [Candidatus Vallotia tarda]|uniref:Uncharacterized protein n=1 Tax=Candidatus Vallotiella hemipterorum TaxID=1177213 RepID=A0A8E4GHM1_9BURK|nr:hypothetical protein [Candidatus Vallotia tarda]CAD6506697.1 hypothetical protein VALLOT_H_00180 [Candidatus Vallotia tarda]CAG7605316.1 hypothetical protein MYVALT_H_00180 [Candidatus Vallotia tarda]